MASAGSAGACGAVAASGTDAGRSSSVQGGSSGMTPPEKPGRGGAAKLTGAPRSGGFPERTRSRSRAASFAVW